MKKISVYFGKYRQEKYGFATFYQGSADTVADGKRIASEKAAKGARVGDKVIVLQKRSRNGRTEERKVAEGIVATTGGSNGKFVHWTKAGGK